MKKFIAWLLVIAVLICTNKTINGRREYLYPLVPFKKEAFMRLFFRKLKKMGKDAYPAKR